jgi:hypothetical protein
MFEPLFQVIAGDGVISPFRKRIAPEDPPDGKRKRGEKPEFLKGLETVLRTGRVILTAFRAVSGRSLI